MAVFYHILLSLASIPHYADTCAFPTDDTEQSGTDQSRAGKKRKKSSKKGKRQPGRDSSSGSPSVAGPSADASAACNVVPASVATAADTKGSKATIAASTVSGSAAIGDADLESSVAGDCENTILAAPSAESKLEALNSTSCSFCYAWSTNSLRYVEHKRDMPSKDDDEGMSRLHALLPRVRTIATCSMRSVVQGTRAIGSL